MLGIDVSEGTANGWFGRGKTSAIASIAVIVVLILGIAFGVFAAVNAGGGKTSISQPNIPAASTVSTPAEPTPTQTPAIVTEPGVVVLTVEELLNQVITDPNKYKEGTTMQITGIAVDYQVGQVEDYLFLGPEVQDFHVDVGLIKDQTSKTQNYLIGKFAVGEKNFPITIRGTFYRVSQLGKKVELRGGTLVK